MSLSAFFSWSKIQVDVQKGLKPLLVRVPVLARHQGLENGGGLFLTAVQDVRNSCIVEKIRVLLLIFLGPGKSLDQCFGGEAVTLQVISNLSQVHPGRSEGGIQLYRSPVMCQALFLVSDEVEGIGEGELDEAVILFRVFLDELLQNPARLLVLLPVNQLLRLIEDPCRTDREIPGGDVSVPLDLTVPHVGPDRTERQQVAEETAGQNNSQQCSLDIHHF